MEWLTALALLPALACAVMMGGMGLAAALGLRRSPNDSTSASTPTAPGTERRSTGPDRVSQ